VHADLEIIKVLQTAAEDLDAEELVDWGIPYDRILSIVNELLQTGHLEAAEGKLVVTATGRTRLEAGQAMLANRRAQRRAVIEPVHSAAQPVVDYIPPELVD
jgi:hypothetical protein